MIEQIKALNGMLALEQFTVQQVQRLTGVKPSTIYTTIRRRPEYVERAPGSPNLTGRRGGQIVLYQLKPAAVEDLKEEILRVTRAVAAEPTSEGEDDTAPPLNLEAAEEFLTDRLEGARTLAEKRSMLETADVYLGAAQVEFEERFSAQDIPLAQERWRRIATLMELRQAAEAKVGLAEIKEITERHINILKRSTPAPMDAWSACIAAMGVGATAGTEPHVIIVHTTGTARSPLIRAVADALRKHSALRSYIKVIDAAQARTDRGVDRFVREANRAECLAGVIMSVDSNHDYTNRVVENLIAASPANAGTPVVLDAHYNKNLRSFCYSHNAYYEGGASGLNGDELWHMLKRPLALGVFEAGSIAAYRVAAKAEAIPVTRPSRVAAQSFPVSMRPAQGS